MMTKPNPLLSLGARVLTFLQRPFFTDPRTLLGLWILIPVISWLMRQAPAKHNNFLIFRGVFWHTIQQTPLYDTYPSEYYDLNYYGPVFSLVVAPFALPSWPIGMLFWLITLSLALYYAVRKLPLEDWKQIFLYYFCVRELLTALHMQQFNIAIAAIIIGCFAAIERRKELLAAFLIILGTLVKLYGVVGLAFFFFVKRKPRFILGLVGASIILFVAPMLISSPEYVIGQYQQWFEHLMQKNGMNTFSLRQNISLLGLVRKATMGSYSDLWIMIPGLILFALPYLRIKQYKHLAFRYGILSSVLLFVVLFSTGSESSTYIIPFTGIALWYTTAPWKRSWWDLALVAFAFFFRPSDLFPSELRRTHLIIYTLTAIPSTLVWLRLSWELLTRDYSDRGKPLEAVTE